MSLLAKVNKRKCYPVELEDRTVYVRSMKGAEIDGMEALPRALRTPYVMGICVVFENGKQEIPREKDEAIEAYAHRVQAALDEAEVDTEVISKLSTAIGKIGKVDVEDVQKN
jgi:hypothetical protein